MVQAVDHPYLVVHSATAPGQAAGAAAEAGRKAAEASREDAQAEAERIAASGKLPLQASLSADVLKSWCLASTSPLSS